MANEFKVKNGLVIDAGGINSTGSINATGSVQITGSLIVGTSGTPEFQITTAGTIMGNVITDVHAITGSVQISGSLNATASNAINAISASYHSGSGLISNAVSSSYAISATTASYGFFLNQAQSNQVQLQAPLGSTISTLTINNVTSASYGATSSYANNFTVAGTLTAQTIVAQTITSSITYSSGSNIFGSTTTNTHQFTGSVLTNATNPIVFAVNTNTIYVSSSNNVGIGALPSNTYKLEVGGTVGATGYYETSDIRLKKIIDTNPLIDLSSINVIKYSLIGSEDIHYGYSAQQVQSVCSDLVKSGEYLSLNYTDIHTLKILQLEQKIAQLEAQLLK